MNMMIVVTSDIAAMRSHCGKPILYPLSRDCPMEVSTAPLTNRDVIYSVLCGTFRPFGYGLLWCNDHPSMAAR